VNSPRRFTRLGVLSRGVDTRQFSPAHRSPALRGRLGRRQRRRRRAPCRPLAVEKNYPLLFRATPPCVAPIPPAVRPRQRRSAAAGAAGAHPECIFTGFIPRDDLARHYASADVYVHASLTETFGNVLLEAMASGLAVVSFDYAAARQFVRHGANGLAVPCDQPGAFVAAAADSRATTPCAPGSVSPPSRR